MRRGRRNNDDAVRTVGVVGAVALVLASAASGRSSVSQDAALVFGRSVGNIEAIYAVAGDGTQLTQLTAGPNDTDPAWSRTDRRSRTCATTAFLDCDLRSTSW